MAIIRIKKHSINFVQIDKNILQNKKLSLKAKGLICYLLSLPNNWQIYKNELQQHATDGRDSTNAAFKELIKAGYIEQNRTRDKKGNFIYNYTVYECPNYKNYPLTENPLTGNPSTDKTQENKEKAPYPLTEKPLTENPQLIINKEIKEKINKKEIFKDYRPTENLPFDPVSAFKTLQTIDNNYIIDQVQEIHGLTISADQIKTAARSFAMVGVANYDKYRFIRDPQQLIFLFIGWIPKNLKFEANNKSQDTDASPDDIRQYLKSLYGNNYFIKCLDGEKHINKFIEHKAEIISELKKYENKNLDLKLLFLILITPLGNAYCKNPRFNRRAAAFEYWYNNLSDYNQKHGDLLKLLRKELNKNN